MTRSSRSTKVADIRLVLDVTYVLHGERSETLAEELCKNVENAIGRGLLTGETAAEVEAFSIDALPAPQPSRDGGPKA